MITYVWPPQSVAVAVPPVQFLKNGANQTVIEDTAVPANNNPLPAGMYILKDGIAYPVGIDTVTPANTISVPVRLESATGPINITAGDLNVQLSDAGANFDATRIGDGSGIYLQVNADGSINVQDAAALAKLTSLLAVDFATSAKQDAAKAVLDLIKTNGDTLNAKDFSTSAKQDAAKTVLDSINTKDFSTAAKQDLAKAVLDLIKTNGDTLNLKDFSTATNQAALAVLTGPVTETAPATDTASSGLNGRLQRIAQRITSLMSLLPTSLGQKAMAASLAVTVASDQSAISVTRTGLTPSYQEDLAVTDGTVKTFTAPAGAKWCKIQADDANSGNARVKLGAAATTTSGIQLEPGRSEDFEIGGNISYVMEAGMTGKLYVQFGA